MKKFIVLLVSFLVAVAPSMALAADFNCDVTIRDVLVYGDGSVNVFHSGRNDYTVICNISSARLGVQPATCGAWVAMLLSMKKRNVKARFWYNADGSCATLARYWESPAPVYIGDVN